MKGITRREYLKKSAAATAGLIAIPTIVPASVIGKNPPSDKINIAQIGFGRIAKDHDLKEVLKYDVARVIAVADVDSNRANHGKSYIENTYAEQKKKKNYVDVKVYEDYREMLMNKDIDAVIISTPDHWHAQPAIEAAIAGKDIYLQKPASLTVEEGRAMSNVVHKTGRVFQIGSQQRSANPWPQFKRACELVRNGRIGELKTVQVGLGTDPGGEQWPEMPVPENLNYDMWLGSTPETYYTEKGVHPQADYSRPGWLRIQQFGAGMITGWGAHHIDTAHWGMGTEFTGPIELEGTALFPKSGMWNVHGDFRVETKYANGVEMIISSEFTNGVRFEGTEGWIFVSRGNVGVTASDPKSAQSSEAFSASNDKILKSEIGKDEIHLYHSAEQHGNWLDCIKSRELTIAPAEVAHRSCSTCLIAHTAMQIPRKLYWDPINERFKNDDEANATLSRPQRYPYGHTFVKGLEKF
ncbi:MAG: Gfo/Idh/MocA family oxidoreductase [Cyclobacteriaceae bacterium]|nr:Gfo/Idh/MocA family oxidoreductase [Cyclobacteriaceae bacterium]